MANSFQLFHWRVEELKKNAGHLDSRINLWWLISRSEGLTWNLMVQQKTTCLKEVRCSEWFYTSCKIALMYFAQKFCVITFLCTVLHLYTWCFVNSQFLGPNDVVEHGTLPLQRWRLQQNVLSNVSWWTEMYINMGICQMYFCVV